MTVTIRSMFSPGGTLLTPRNKNRLPKLVEEALTNVPIENIKLICESRMIEQPFSHSNTKSHLLASGLADINVDNNLPL